MTSDERMAAIEAVYSARFPYFVRVAVAIVGDRDTAMQVVQDAFANVIQARRGFRAEGPLEAWIWRVVVRCARRAAQERAIGGLPDELRVSENGGPSGEFAALRTAIAVLPERQRLVVFLRYYADLDYAQIAHVLGVKVGTVSASLHAAHRSLRATLDAEEVQR